MKPIKESGPCPTHMKISCRTGRKTGDNQVVFHFTYSGGVDMSN